MTPLVSILIPCYNAEQWIDIAIQSALDQTWTSKEVIVVDDGSTDRSLEVIRSFGDAIRFESGPNRGGNVARNRLLELSTGEWLQYLDADDYLLPAKIWDQLSTPGVSSTTDAIYSPLMLEYWGDGVILRHELASVPNPCDPWILLARWQIPGTPGVLWRRSSLVDIGGWKIDQPCCQEHELYLRALIAGKTFLYCGAPGAIYRQWSEKTVCKKNIPELHRRRLEIHQLMETFLRSRGELTQERLQALNQTRFETARSAWQYDHDFATQIMHNVMMSQPHFIPEGAAAPAIYRALFALFGFRNTEHLATWKRLLLRTAGPK